MIICDRCRMNKPGIEEEVFYGKTDADSDDVKAHLCQECYDRILLIRYDLLRFEIDHGHAQPEPDKYNYSLPEKPVGAGWIVGTILALFLAVLGAVFGVAWLCAHMHVGFH